MNSFRILIVDDQYWSGACEAISEKKPEVFAKNHVLYPLVNVKLETSKPEVFISKDGAFNGGDVYEIHSKIAKNAAELAGEKLGGFLRSINILILDLSGFALRKPLISSDRIKSNMEGISKRAVDVESIVKDLDEITTGKYPGIGFYHQFLDDLRYCDAVIVLTQHDEADPSKAPRELKTYLWPFCQGRHDHPSAETDPVLAGEIPWTTMAPKSEKGSQQIKSVVESRYQEWMSGITDPANQGAKELAALHDDPVVLLGETGTGKEKMARSIHDRWVRNKSREQAKKPFPNAFVVVNCAGLSAELARSELFGHVAGSFTDAKDHRLGAILKACGVVSLEPATKPKQEEFRRALGELEAATEALNNITGSTHPTTAQQYRVVFAQLQQIFALTGASSTAKKSLIEALFEAGRRLERASRGASQVEDFYERLAHCQNVEKEGSNELGIRYVGNQDDQGKPQPTGTLFLDEFGDLPLIVQTLLLRFLDAEIGEIQPIGYPGGITGIKVRLIVATSDPRVAEFFGVTDFLGGRRSEEEERMRPLRQDLLFRLKHQVIRVEPVTPQNVSRVIDDLISRSDICMDVDWTAATTHLCELVTTLIKQIKDGESRAFGHRRELQQFLQRVAHFVLTAGDRGLRGVAPQGKDGKPKVTKDVVGRLWRPATVSVTPLAQGTRRSIPSGVPWTLDQFEKDGKLEKHTILYHIIEILLKSVGSEVSGESIANQINGLQLKSRKGKTVRTTTEQITKKISDLKTRVLPKKCPACGFELLSNANGYKLEPKS